MNSFEILYLCFGGFVCLAGATMIVVYTVAYPWWRDHLGRMMVTYAAAEVAMAAILLLAVVAHIGPHWFRVLWFILQAVVGGCFCYQTWTIIALQRARRAHREEAPDVLVPVRDQDGAAT